MRPGASAHWHLSNGDFSILCASSLIRHCKPHFHETYTFASLRDGEAHIQLRDSQHRWLSGQVIIINPYEILSGITVSSSLVYEVCYPCLRFMTEACAVRRTESGKTPRLTTQRLTAVAVQELASILNLFSDKYAATMSAPEERLIGFIRAHPELVETDQIGGTEALWVSRVCRRVEASLDRHVGVRQIAEDLGCDRSHLMRVFRHATGLPPSSYIRQLRLARALDAIRKGTGISATAVECGFSDQAHLTREFKRVYGTTPGKLTRDIGPPSN